MYWFTPIYAHLEKPILQKVHQNIKKKGSMRFPGSTIQADDKPVTALYQLEVL